MRLWIAIPLLLLIVAAFIGIDPASRKEALSLGSRLGLWEEEKEHELVTVRDEEGRIKYWTCTMHPSVRAADPGTCPI